MTVEELRQIPAFADVSDGAARLLAAAAMERSFPSGTLIWRQGSRAHSLHVLLAGTARAVRSRRGRQSVLHRAKAGDTLGEIPLFDGDPYPASLIAESPVRVAALHRDSLIAAMHLDVGLAMAFLHTLGRRVRDLAERLESYTSDPVRARLARHLLARSDASARGDFDLGMTQGELAEELGTVREVVARGLAHLVRVGALHREGRGRYRIADRSRIEEQYSG